MIKKSLVTALALCALLSGCNTHVHSYSVSVVQPSCEEDGFTLYRCACDDAYVEHVVKALEHDYEEVTVPPTYTTQGYTSHTCRRCGKAYTDAFTQMPEEVVAPTAVKDYLLPFESFSRAREHNPEFVMIHFTSAVVLSKTDPYNQELVRGIFEDYGVSVHYIIDRDGSVSCYIPENLVAYHAGKGTWKDDPAYTNRLNDYAIGIEIVAIGSKDDMKQYLTASEYAKLDPALIGYTQAQYDALKILVQDICTRNQIPMDREHIIGHEEYSPTKTDPGELFDWDRLLDT